MIHSPIFILSYVAVETFKQSTEYIINHIPETFYISCFNYYFTTCQQLCSVSEQRTVKDSVLLISSLALLHSV